ncbi:TonB family protein [Colwelliaceae bacterium 6471]
MNPDHIDKEINQLYQQRKNSIKAPAVDVGGASLNRPSKFSIAGIVTIFSMGGLVSFALLAIISHFASEPIKPMLTSQVSHQIDLEQPKPEQIADKAISVKQVLPPKPAHIPLKIKPPITVDNSNSPSAEIDLNIKVAKVIVVPRLTQPEIELTPKYKVMPQYTAKAIIEKQSGAIKLTYQIDTQGKVENIEVLASDVNRELQRSAKQALAKWQFDTNLHSKKRHEIIFEFTLDDG